MGPIQKYADKIALCNDLYNATVLSLGCWGWGEGWPAGTVHVIIPQVVARLAARWVSPQVTTAASLLW